MGNKDASYWIEKLRLEPHPEGGFFRQTYRSDIQIAAEALPARFSGERTASTAIYFCWAGMIFQPFIGCDRMRYGISTWGLG